MHTYVSRLLAALLVVGTLTLASTVPPAAGAGADVLTMEWSNASDSGGLATTSATFTPSAATSAAPGGASVRFPSGSSLVKVAPPTGTRFQAGTTYPSAWTASSTTAELAFSSFEPVLFPGRVCGVTAVPPPGASYTGTVSVQAAEYDDAGQLTALAVDYRATCTLFNGSQQTVVGSVRHGSQVPYLGIEPSYAYATAGIGKEATSTVTFRGRGDGSTVGGAATLSGPSSADYRVSANGCQGVAISQGVSCGVTLTFRPGGTESGRRDAVLTLVTPGHLQAGVTVHLADRAVAPPSAATALTTYPTSTGVGVAWRRGSVDADEYRVERRRDGESDWTVLASLPYSGTWSYQHVDHGLQPGEHATYRVIGSVAGWEGPEAAVEGTRPADLPVAGSSSLVAYRWNDPDIRSATIRSGADGGVVSTSGGGYPGVTATAPAGAPGQEPDSVTLGVPLVPGPGTYRITDSTGTSFTPLSSMICNSWVDRVLEVRSVVFDDAGAPLVLDASWVGRCAYGTVARVEVRLGVDGGVTFPAVDPAVVGPVRTSAGRPLARTVTVSNPGPETLTLGDATTTGTASGDWAVTGNACRQVTLAAGESCAVTVRFAISQAGSRPAALEVAVRDLTGPLAPVTVPLDGFGTTPPGPVVGGSVVSSVDAMLTYWYRPSADGGESLTSYDLERSVGDGPWLPLAQVPADGDVWTPSYVDRDTDISSSYSYRVRARNDAGAGPWTSIGWPHSDTGRSAVVVSGRRAGAGTARGLFQVASADWYAPVVPLTSDPDHDYRDPAASWSGGRLVVSRSIGATGADGEYDLWAGTPRQPARQRLTTMVGGERDAEYSPDGSQVAFTHEVDGARSVWVVGSAGGTPRMLRNGAAAPAWAPDGATVVVEDDSAADAPLLRVDLSSGVATPVEGTAGGTEPALDRTGSIAFGDGSGRIMQVATGATTATVLRAPQSDQRLRSPAYGPSGELFADVTRVSTGVNVPSLTSRLVVAGEPAGLFGDKRRPWVEVAGPSDVVRGSASMTVTAGDWSETPDAALQTSCRLDDGDWFDCLGAVDLDPVPDGTHVFEARAIDDSGHVGTRSTYVTSDATPPVLRMRPPSDTQVLGGSATFTFSMSDALSAGEHYDVTVRRAVPGGPFGAYTRPSGWQSSQYQGWMTTSVAIGQELCVRARAQDASGLYSPYQEQCVARPVDDRSFRISSGWRRRTEAGLLARTETVASRKGAAMVSSRPVTVRRVGVVGVICPRCGSVKVYVGATYVGTAKFAAAGTRYRRMRYLPVLRTARTGKVTLRTTSKAKVRVDGVLLQRG